MTIPKAKVEFTTKTADISNTGMKNFTSTKSNDASLVER